MEQKNLNYENIKMLNQKIKKTVIFLGYKCNNRCIFCINFYKRNLPNKTTSQAKRDMIEARKKRADYIELIGGESTIRPDIIELIRFAKGLGFSTIMMSTNGMMYSYRDFSREILKAGLNSIVFSIHGHTAKLHDSLTQVPGSYKRLRRGVENVKEVIEELNLKVHIGSNTCIIKQNYKYLPQIGEYIRSLGIGNSEFIFVDPTYGAAHTYFEKLVPRISKIAPYVHKCLDIGKGDHILHWHIRYVPLCYFLDYLDQISELQEVETFHTEHLAPDFENLNVEESRKEVGRAKTKKCQGCKLYNRCEGIWKVYLQHYGDGELRPVKSLTKGQKTALSSYRKGLRKLDKKVA